MRSENQQRASRENGAKSQGPTTPEGKANSARNSTKHGLTARNPILLTVEDHQAYQTVREEYEKLFQPANVVERQLIHEMVSVQRRRQRAEGLEASTLDFAIDRMANDVAPASTKSTTPRAAPSPSTTRSTRARRSTTCSASPSRSRANIFGC